MENYPVKIALMVSPRSEDRARQVLQRDDYIVIDDSNFTLDPYFITPDTRNKTDLNWEDLTYSRGDIDYSDNREFATYKRHCVLLEKADLVCFSYELQEFSWRHWHDVIYALLAGKTVALANDGKDIEVSFNFKQLQELVKKEERYQIFLDLINWSLKIAPGLASVQHYEVSNCFIYDLEAFTYLTFAKPDRYGIKFTVDPWSYFDSEGSVEAFDVACMDLNDYSLIKELGAKKFAKYICELMARYLSQFTLSERSLFIDKNEIYYDPRFVDISRLPKFLRYDKGEFYFEK